jgi:succinate-semialdehyde dehydrogenase/glutarate-semialdehyde dehydrogenase
VANGATVLAGGRARPDLGPMFFEPTVLVDTPPAAQCYAEETFGPLVSVYRFHDLDDAITSANDTDYGLNASLWTRDISKGYDVAGRLRAGTVNLNEAFAAAWGSVDAPMGGMGASGLGRRHGVEGLLKYTEAQTVARQRISNLAPPPGISDAVFAKALTFGLAALKRLGWT